VQIDWFTVAAQIVNFLILLYFLRRFLFKPIVRVMDERQAQIAARFEEAKEQTQAAKFEAEQLRESRAALEKQRHKLLEEARQEAKHQKQQLLEEAQADIASRHQRWRKNLNKEHVDFLNQMRHDIGSQAIEITRQALNDLAGEGLENQVIDHFFHRLDNLDDHQRQELQKAVETMAGRIIVRSAFGISGEHRGRLAKLLREKLFPDNSTPLDIEFERSAELIGGIELYGSGQKLGWSFNHYLDQLEDRVRTIIEEKTRLEVQQIAEEIGEEPGGEE